MVIIVIRGEVRVIGVPIEGSENPKTKGQQNEENKENKNRDVLERAVGIVVGDLEVLRRVGLGRVVD